MLHNILLNPNIILQSRCACFVCLQLMQLNRNLWPPVIKSLSKSTHFFSYLKQSCMSSFSHCVTRCSVYETVIYNKLFLLIVVQDSTVGADF